VRQLFWIRYAQAEMQTSPSALMWTAAYHRRTSQPSAPRLPSIARALRRCRARCVHCAELLKTVERPLALHTHRPCALQAQAASMATMAQAAQVGAGLASSGTQAVRAAGGAGQLGGAAALGGAAGLILLGPLGAVAAAGAAAYAATRSDEVGDVARSAGRQAVDCVSAAKNFDAQHDISGRAAAAARAGVSKAKELEAKYDISAKAKAGAESALKSARELEAKHQVTAKLGNLMGRGLDRLSSMLDTKAPAPAPHAPGSSFLPSVPR